MTKDEQPDNLLLSRIIFLHEAYHKIESQLQHLKRMATIEEVSKKLQAYFDLKLKETDDIVSSTALYNCSYSLYHESNTV